MFVFFLEIIVYAMPVHKSAEIAETIFCQAIMYKRSACVNVLYKQLSRRWRLRGNEKQKRRRSNNE